MNRDGYETAWTGPGESITGNEPWPYPTEDMTDGEDCPILWDGCAPTYREEPTAAGLQLVIPGCERRPPDNGKPAQLSLWE